MQSPFLPPLSTPAAAPLPARQPGPPQAPESPKNGPTAARDAHNRLSASALVADIAA